MKSVLSSALIFAIIGTAFAVDKTTDSEVDTLLADVASSPCNIDAKQAVSIKLDAHSLLLPADFVFRGLDGGMARFVQGTASTPQTYAYVYISLENENLFKLGDYGKLISDLPAIVRIEHPAGNRPVNTLYQISVFLGKYKLTLTTTSRVSAVSILSCFDKVTN